MRRDEARRRALEALRARIDLSETPVPELTQAIKNARTEQGDLREFIGRAAAQLNATGMTFAQMSKLTGMPHSTLHLWAKEYL